jgi:glycosyltransferase involved in cell wall biosynthesis
VIAGPDEQGTLAALERQARRLGLRLEACDPLAPAVPPAGDETEAPGLDLDPTIIYAGPHYGDEKLRLLHEADLVVLPSRSENFGLVVAEALAAGVPVVTTKAAPWRELLGQDDSCDDSVVARERVKGEKVKGEKVESERVRKEVGGRCGWWVEVGVEPLAEALREAMALTDVERRILGANGRRLVEAKYRWEAVAERVIEA